jgi:hypothetical protein
MIFEETWIAIDSWEDIDFASDACLVSHMERFGYEREDYLLLKGPALLFAKSYFDMFDAHIFKYPFVLEDDIQLHNNSRIWVTCGADANIALRPNIHRISLSR